MKSKQRSFLLKTSHSLQPSVMIGTNGLTEGVVFQTEQMLEQHELIKMKFQDYKSNKKEITQKLAKTVDAEIVKIIGNIAIFYRQARNPEKRKIKLP